jgi:transposase
MDDRIRMAEYGAIYGDPVLSTKYGYRALPSIHIIVKNGNVTLRGVVAGEADKNLVYVRANKTAAQIAQMFGVHPTQVGGWKKQALAGLPDIFGNGREQMRQQADTEKDELYKQIGQLKVELDFLKKRAGLID